MKLSECFQLSLPISILLTACGGGTTPAAESPEAASESDSLASDPSVPVPPTAVNAGTKISNALVDDLEDGDSKSLLADKRGGYWYTYKDDSTEISPSGEFEVSEGGAGGSKYAARMHGKVGDAQYPYAGIGVSFTDPKQPYDVSSCEGVAFSAKSGIEEATKLRIKVGDWQTSPEGQLCKDCYNDFGADYVLTQEWQDFSLKFADMKQEPYWGDQKAGIDKRALYQLQWQVAKVGAEFDVWIDNARFIGCSDAPEIEVPPEPPAAAPDAALASGGEGAATEAAPSEDSQAADTKPAAAQ